VVVVIEERDTDSNCGEDDPEADDVNVADSAEFDESKEGFEGHD